MASSSSFDRKKSNPPSESQSTQLVVHATINTTFYIPPTIPIKLSDFSTWKNFQNPFSNFLFGLIFLPPLLLMLSLFKSSNLMMFLFLILSPEKPNPNYKENNLLLSLLSMILRFLINQILLILLQEPLILAIKRN